MEKYNICFVKPEGYIHSAVFSELGELIFYSLRELGYEVVVNINKIELGFKNIIIGFHLLPLQAIQSLPESSVLFNTEQIYEEDSPWAQKVYSYSKKYQVWDYSQRNIERFKQLGILNIKYFKIGFQKELVRLDLSKPKEIDVLFYGSVNERRKPILDSLESSGLRIKVLFGSYGEERDSYIEKSKIILNHHFYNSHIFEIVRVFYLLTNSVAVVGEVNESTFINPIYKSCIFPSCYDKLVESCIELVNNDELREELQLKAFNSFSSFPQKIFTAEVLD